MTCPTHRTRFAEMQPATQAGILCNDPAFQRFAAARCQHPGQILTAAAAAEWLRQQCGITSRAALNTTPTAAALNTTPTAAARFAAIHTDFDAWRGNIAPQR